METQNKSQKQSLDHLKCYVQILEGKGIERFLHLITGSDVIACEHITVEFNTLNGFDCRPTVHTCCPVLELLTIYNSYTDLSSLKLCINGNKKTVKKSLVLSITAAVLWFCFITNVAANEKQSV